MRSKNKQPKMAIVKNSSYRSYSPSAMAEAYRAVMEDNVPVKRAAITFKVPQTTLRQRVLNRVNPENTSSGPAPVLSQEEEGVYVEHLKSMAAIGYGYSANEVTNMASDYAIFLGKRDANNPFSTKWYRCFMKRWPELSVTKPKALMNYRDTATSDATMTGYFDRLDHILTEFDMKGKPQCIYTVDEKNIQTEHTLLDQSTNSSSPMCTAASSNTTTIIGCGNASGHMMPPFYIFKGKKYKKDFLDGSSAGAKGTVTESGWSNSQAFMEFLENHFLIYIKRDSENEKILLVFDGHTSYINIPVILWAEEHNIVLFVLPAHTGYLLHPLRVACFEALDRIFSSERHKLIRTNHSSKITRHNEAELSSKAYEHALCPENLMSGFKLTGIYPFNPSAVDAAILGVQSETADEEHSNFESDVSED